MRQMGVKQEELPAEEVIIRLADRDIIIPVPTVMLVDMMGQVSFQISGEVEERPREAAPEISDADVDAVVSQCGCTPEEARKKLEENSGDIAKAYLLIKFSLAEKERRPDAGL